MDGRKVVRIMVGASAIVAGLVGAALWMAATEGPMSDGEGGPLAAGAYADRGCRPDEGSSKPYPPTGEIALSKDEQAVRANTVGLSIAGLSQKAMGKVTLENEDPLPATALFVDEDGRPLRKAFIRAKESMSMDLPAGAYDVMARGGQDWNGVGFGACSTSVKVKGIAVVEPGRASHVAMYGELAFVLANRMELADSDRLLTEELAAKAKAFGEADAAAKAARPERDSRP